MGWDESQETTLSGLGEAQFQCRVTGKVVWAAWGCVCLVPPAFYKGLLLIFAHLKGHVSLCILLVMFLQHI